MVCSIFSIPQIVDFFHLFMEIYFGVQLQKKKSHQHRHWNRAERTSKLHNHMVIKSVGAGNYWLGLNISLTLLWFAV